MPLPTSGQGDADSQDDADYAPAATIAVQTISMAVLIMILATTDAKRQSLFAVGIAAFAGSSAGDYFFPSRRAGATRRWSLPERRHRPGRRRWVR